jgi:hypothetical protein
MGRDFKPGQSGNPKGRPRGIPDKRSRYRALLEDDAPDLLKKAVKMAKDGDPSMLRLCVERLVPVPRAQAEPIELPAEDRFKGDVSTWGEQIMQLVVTGKINTQQGEEMAKIVQTIELEKRLKALESVADNKNGAA